MKFTALLALVAATCLSSCTSDGSFDAAGFSSAVGAASDAYRASQPPIVVGYDPAGRPIYGRP